MSCYGSLELHLVIAVLKASLFLEHYSTFAKVCDTATTFLVELTKMKNRIPLLVLIPQ